MITAERVAEAVLWLVAVAVISGFCFVIFKNQQMHSEGEAKCHRMGGVWLDRNLMCIEGKELK